LKYYLPLLALQENEWCVIDGVAGVDMMNFGLFLGANALIVVVEPHPNSIRVYREVSRIAAESNLVTKVIINKSRLGEARDALLAEVGERLIAELPIDEGVLTYDFAAVKSDTKAQMDAAIDHLLAGVTPGGGLKRLRAFEAKRQQMKASVNA
jgi:CO dehydrogenase nickel-insertion accessory protein CooC1